MVFYSINLRQRIGHLIHRFNQASEGLIDEVSFDFHGGRYFPVLFIKLLGQDGELFDLL